MAQILVVNTRNGSNYIFYALRQWDYEVKIVQTTADCRQALSTEKFDIVFIRLEPDEDLSTNFRIIRETQSNLPIIGLTDLSKGELDQVLADLNIAHSDFINIFHQPISLEDLVFVIEEIMTRSQEEPLEEEKPLTKKERQARLAARRRPLEDKRLSDFLSAHLKQNVFEE